MLMMLADGSWRQIKSQETGEGSARAFLFDLERGYPYRCDNKYPILLSGDPHKTFYGDII